MRWRVEKKNPDRQSITIACTNHHDDLQVRFHIMHKIMIFNDNDNYKHHGYLSLLNTTIVIYRICWKYRLLNNNGWSCKTYSYCFNFPHLLTIFTHHGKQVFVTKITHNTSWRKGHTQIGDNDRQDEQKCRWWWECQMSNVLTPFIAKIR